MIQQAILVAGDKPCQHDTRVLLVDHSGSAVGGVLDSEFAEVIRCCTASAAREEFRKADVILLSLDLPGLDGPSFLAELRLVSAVPILAYSRWKDVDSAVAALQCGADDYMVEPVPALELLARMNAIRRRVSARCPLDQIVRVGDIEICLHMRTVKVGGEPVRFTSREFELLSILARNAGTVVSREKIMREIWGRASLTTSRNLDVQMAAVRSKLGRPNLLLTIRGVGYCLGHRPDHGRG